METKYTPGHWYYSEKDHEQSAHNKSIWVKGASYNYRLAKIYGNPEDEAIANAKLIAAAPNMLELLIKIKDRIENHDEWWIGLPDKGGFDLDAINDTIKRATE